MKNKNSDHSMAHVLYQKLGAQWYAFTEVDGDMFMGKIEDGEVPAEVLAKEEDKNVIAINGKKLPRAA